MAVSTLLASNSFSFSGDPSPWSEENLTTLVKLSTAIAQSQPSTRPEVTEYYDLYISQVQLNLGI